MPARKLPWTERAYVVRRLSTGSGSASERAAEASLFDVALSLQWLSIDELDALRVLMPYRMKTPVSFERMALQNLIRRAKRLSIAGVESHSAADAIR